MRILLRPPIIPPLTEGRDGGLAAEFGWTFGTLQVLSPRPPSRTGTLATTAVQFGNPLHEVDEAPILVLRPERSRGRPLPRQVKLLAITSGLGCAFLIVVSVVDGIITSSWLLLWVVVVSFVIGLVVAVYRTVRRRGRLEVTASQLRFVDGFGRAQSVPLSEVSSLVRCTIELGRQRVPALAVLVMDKTGRVRLRFSHYIDVGRLAATIGVPVTGRFEDRLPHA